MDPSTLVNLPNTAHTLLKTNKVPVETKVVSGMDYTNLGVKTSLVRNLNRYPKQTRDNVETLEISLNVDGLPLFKSSKKGVWPILCALHLDPVSVFPLSITFGQTKPTSLDFLTENVAELKAVLESGLEVDGRVMGVKVRNKNKNKNKNNHLFS